jgi:hypothetical protein
MLAVASVSHPHPLTVTCCFFFSSTDTILFRCCAPPPFCLCGSRSAMLLYVLEPNIPYPAPVLLTTAQPRTSLFTSVPVCRPLVLPIRTTREWHLAHFGICRPLGKGKFGCVYMVCTSVEPNYILALECLYKLEIVQSRVEKQVRRETEIRASSVQIFSASTTRRASSSCSNSPARSSSAAAYTCVYEAV